MKCARTMIATAFVSLMGLASMATPTVAQITAQTTQVAQLSSQLQWNPPPPPESLGEPGGRGQGAGSRGDCKYYKFVVPLVPRTKFGVRWGQTVDAQPKLWMYAPLGVSENLPIELRLLEQDGRSMTKRRIRTKATSRGAIAVAFPELEPNKTYWWELAVYCNAEFPDVPVVRRGIIQRVPLTSKLQQSLNQISDPVGKANFYAAKGLWFNAMETITGANVALPTRDKFVTDLFTQAKLSQFDHVTLHD